MTQPATKPNYYVPIPTRPLRVQMKGDAQRGSSRAGTIIGILGDRVQVVFDDQPWQKYGCFPEHLIFLGEAKED